MSETESVETSSWHTAGEGDRNDHRHVIFSTRAVCVIGDDLNTRLVALRRQKPSPIVASHTRISSISMSLSSPARRPDGAKCA